ncbi:uncharacterized protein [Ptychodera flava]|uniref:uncharacterized protein n=1 Tax=Ptychodera flava TaxID=63121 RepID=UPI003969FB8E
MQPLTEIAQMMARQRLPLQQPITFGGDSTMYMSWKRSFEATGLKPVMEKLPRFVLNKWRDNVASYKRRHKTFPPFKFFKDFLKDTAKAACDPDIPRPDDTHLEQATGHDLKDCKAFAKQPVADRIELCKKKGLCFKCTEKHLAKDCTSTIECAICKSKKHITCLHTTPGDRSKQKTTEAKPEDKEKGTQETTTKCTRLTKCQAGQNDNIPSDKNKIPTPDICKAFKHLKPIIDYIPEPKKNVGIHLLIGRNCPEPLKVRETRNGPVNSPWAQRTDLGWTISGELCLETARGVIRTSVHRTTATLNGYDESALECNHHIHIKDIISPKPINFGTTVFKRTPYDEQKAPSIEDKQFLDIMQREVHVNEEGNLELPLPFRQDPKKLPNNRQSALNRFYNLQNQFQRKPQMMEEYFQFMKKITERDHASPVPEDEIDADNAWYLPHFGVYHPKKQQIRVVFDSSAKYNGVSLNDALLQGPDQMNSLLGILLRFRREQTAVMGDVEQMFHSFHVNKEHRDYLRFFWFKTTTPRNQ